MILIHQGQIKYFAVLLLVSLCPVVLTRHIRSVDTDDTVTTSPQLPGGSTIPPPPPDGGAKTVLDPAPEDGSAKSNSDEKVKDVIELTQEPPIDIISNRTQPKSGGKAGFGGPPAPNVDEVGKAGTDNGGEVVGGKEEKADKKTEENKDESGNRTPLTSCRVCPPGYGVLKPCTPTTDTVCTPCATGTYSEGYSPTAACKPCSTCSSGFYQRTPCVADADVLCGACHSRGNGYGNEDFLKQCEGATIAPTTTNTGSGSGDEGGELGLSTLEPGLLPVKTVSPGVIDFNTEDPDVMAIGQPHMGQAKDKDKEQQVKSTGFQWPILVACIVSGIIFFIIGILTSMVCKRSAEKKKHNMLENEYDDGIQTNMIRHTNKDYSPSRGSSNYHGSDAATPLNPGK